MSEEESPGKDLNVGDPSEMALEQSTRILKDGVALMRAGEHAQAIRRFEEVYKSDKLPKPVSGLSYYGYCLAKIRKQYRQAIEFGERAINERPDDPAHWANLTEIYMMAGRRVKAVNTIEEALKRFPRTKLLLDIREWVGMRRTPVVPFLDRSNPLNIILGHMRHTLHQKRSGAPAATKKR
ncbi:MAG: tetratricopeptide repeat protein [Thermoanaerobaculia bacterium]|nr:tetratricopeptide repeat protein [Thermoanaerobaculia bacterium]